MASRTYHVFSSNGAWTVKKEGSAAKTFRTQNEAIAAARGIVKKMTKGGQLVVHRKDGSIREYKNYGMPRILGPAKKSPLADRISRAVGKVALMRLQADTVSPRASSPEE